MYGKQTNKPRRALSRTRMAMVIRVQHLQQMSAALKWEFTLAQWCDRQEILKFNSINHSINSPAAASDIIVVRHVDVKHQLLLQGLEGPRLHGVVLIGLWAANRCSFIHDIYLWWHTLTLCESRCMQSHPVTVNGSYVNLVRAYLLHFLLQLGLRAERLVADVDVIFECEGELSILKVVLLHWGYRKKQYIYIPYIY